MGICLRTGMGLASIRQRMGTLPRIKTLLGTLAIMACVVPAVGFTAADPLLDGARQCTQYFPLEEQRKNIPTHLLAAIATTESGRWHEGLNMSVPWPWTINVEGKGYYFNSKAEAIAQTQSLLARGKQSIDVGCMQVNLKHHPKAFANLDAAFDPATNVAYAATFLRDNYAEMGDWIKATAAYHSRTSEHGNRYLGAIERSWNNIVGRVAAARARIQGGAVAPSEAADAAEAASPTVAAAPVAPVREATPQRVIRVANNPQPSADVLVIRPARPPAEDASAPVTARQTTESEMLVQQPAQPQGSTIRRVSLDSPAQNSLPANNNSRFVFAN